MTTKPTTQYKIHLPSGKVIHACDGHDLDKILSLNVCRVYQGCQIRIEPVFDNDPREASAARHLLQSKQVRRTWRSRLMRTESHPHDCLCWECTSGSL